MTGGVGFSSQGKDSYKNNRKLLNNRTQMKDNPYAASQNAKGDRDPANAQELQDWRDKVKSRQKRLRIVIYGILIPLIVVIALLAAIF
jgi:hypothetical protein